MSGGPDRLLLLLLTTQIPRHTATHTHRRIALQVWGHWMEAEASLVRVRGEHYTYNRYMVPAPPYLFKLVHTDMFAVNYKLYHVAARSDSYFQQPGAEPSQRRWPCLVVNLQYPGESSKFHQNCVAYFEPPDEGQLPGVDS